MSDQFCWTCKSFARMADCPTCQMILALQEKPKRRPRIAPSVPAFFARLQTLVDHALGGIDVVDDTDEEKENKT